MSELLLFFRSGRLCSGTWLSVFILAWLFSGSAGLVARPAAVGVPTGPIPVIITASHHHVLPHWFAAVRSKRLPPRGIQVLHMDAHPDLAVPTGPVPGGMPSEDRSLQTSIDIASFQLAAVRAGIINRVIWLRPRQALQLPDGELRFHLGTGKRGRILVDSPEDYYVLSRAYAPLSELRNPVTMEIGVVALKKLAEGGTLPRLEAPWILDIDLDFFSTRNPAVDQMLAVGYKREAVEQIQKIFGRENLSLSEDPRERQADIKAIKTGLDQLIFGAWYEIPGGLLSLWWRGIGPGDVWELFDILGTASETQIDVLLKNGETLVGIPEYYAGDEEILRAIGELESVLRAHKSSPGLITLARSMHDGFTHPDKLPLIESETLKMLARVYRKVRLSYDRGLSPVTPPSK